MSFYGSPRPHPLTPLFTTLAQEGPKLFNALEGGVTPILPHSELKAMGYTVAAYPLTLLSAGAKAMKQSLQLLKEGKSTDPMILEFQELQRILGFPEYDLESNRYKAPPTPPSP